MYMLNITTTVMYNDKDMVLKITTSVTKLTVEHAAAVWNTYMEKH